MMTTTTTTTTVLTVDDALALKKRAWPEDEDSAEDDEVPKRARVMAALMKVKREGSPLLGEEAKRARVFKKREGSPLFGEEAKRARLSVSPYASEDDAPPPNNNNTNDEKKKKTKKTRRPALVKEELARMVREGDAEQLSRRGLNDKGEPRGVLSRSKHDVKGLRGLTTLSLAIYYVFLAASHVDPVQTTKAMETLEVLLDDCGVELKSQKAMVDLIVMPDEHNREMQWEVMQTLMARGFLKRSKKALMHAVGRFIEKGRVGMLCAVLKKRALDAAQTFEVATMVMTYGTEAMLRAVLEAMHRTGSLTAEVRHPKRGSTLLHWAARWEAGKYVEAVLPYSDAKLTDNKGRTALNLLEKAEARGAAVLPERMMALLRMAA